MTQKQIITKPEEIKRVIPLAGGRQLPLSRPLVMGILNVTPDSFSDGGEFDRPEKAVEQALRMEAEGADIIDIGGESTRPGAEPIEPEVEQERILPVIKSVREQSSVCISVDTYRSKTAEVALDAGANIVNDISGLRFDPSMVELVAERKVPVVVMHMLGTPRNMQKEPGYQDCVKEIAGFFSEQIDFCVNNGVDKAKIILDPGIGFGKRLSDNLSLLAHLSRFKKLGLPLLVGASRKSFIGMLHQSEGAPGRRIGGSIAAAVTAARHGADILRVHDVAPTVEALKVLQGIETAG
ncbi:MAG: dihydropteroate synthase [bacterium]|nr:dihydropteroate synthase [bacterium]